MPELHDGGEWNDKYWAGKFKDQEKPDTKDTKNKWNWKWFRFRFFLLLNLSMVF